MSGFITVHGKVVPVGNTNAGHSAGPTGTIAQGPSKAAMKMPKKAKTTGPSGTVAQGPSPAVKQALKRAGTGRSTNHGSSAPENHAPRSGHPHHPSMGKHSPKVGKGHEGDDHAKALAGAMQGKKGPSALGAIANVAKEVIEQPKSSGGE